MIVDTSAIIAILAAEPEADRFRQAIVTHAVKTSAASFLEAAIVLDRRGSAELSAELDRFLNWARARIEPVSATQARIARRAYQEFGRGSGHPARLNFGDCFSYALAIQTAEPLLFKGTDFAHTDVLVAV
jgi:ribonuclease VapC